MSKQVNDKEELKQKTKQESKYKIIYYRDFALCTYIHKQIKYQFTILKGIIKILKTMFASWKI